MNKQQFYDTQVKPVLKAMSYYGNYNSLSARRLLLVSAEVESKCGYYVKQVGGPAQSAFQIEPPTWATILHEWDAYINNQGLRDLIDSFACAFEPTNALINSPLYATAIARGYYAMDPHPLPKYDDKDGMWEYYKRVWNTNGGDTDRTEFNTAWEATAGVQL